MTHDGRARREDLDRVGDVPCLEVLQGEVIGVSSEPVQLVGIEKLVSFGIFELSVDVRDD
jgi:hypothetical protein